MTVTNVTASPGIMVHHAERYPFGTVLRNVEGEGLRGDDFLSAVDLDWTVEKHDHLQVVTEKWGVLDVPGSVTVANDGGVPHPISTVGRKYEPFQHKPMQVAGDAMIDYGHATGWTAGGHLGYQKVFMLLALSAESQLRDGHKRALALTTGNTGTMAMRAKPFAERLFCVNQTPLLFAPRLGIVSIPHTSGGVVRVDALRDTLLRLSGYFDQQDKIIEQMEREFVSTRQVDTFIKEVFPDPKKVLLKPQSAFERGDARAKDALLAKRTDLRFLISSSPTMDNLREQGMSKAVLFHSLVEWSNYYAPTKSKIKAQDWRAKKMLHGTDVPLLRHGVKVLAKV